LIEVTRIEDVRGSKRDFIIERAKKLLEGLDGKGEFGEMSKTLKEESRAAKIVEYGAEKLPAGDLSGNEIIVVEGRADVVNLLKNRVNNVIGMNGTKLPAEIAKLGEEKEITLFIDGDRGGKLIAKNVINNAKIVYVAVAPDGKEVEELQGKEILIALRKRLSTQEFLRKVDNNGSNGNSENENRVETVSEFKGDIKEGLRQAFEKIRGSKNALLLDGNLDIIRKISPREIGKSLSMTRQKVYAVVVDGVATSGIIETCDEFYVKYLAATTFSTHENAKVNLISL
jgi:DNA primase